MRTSLPSRAAFVTLMLVMPSVAFGQWPNGISVDQTPHNLRVPATSTEPDMQGLVRDYGDVCVYCHSPHDGPTWSGSPRAPLFNRPRPNAGYRMPEWDQSQMQQDGSPSNKSRLCLSCHDGTVGLDNILNRPNTYTGPGPANTSIEDCEDCHRDGDPIDWEGVYFRPDDMRDQHPFSVLYDPSQRPGQFNPAIGGTVGGLPLFDGKVECLTCHEPHSQRFKYFLRRSNAGQTLCLVCHTSAPSDPVHPIP